MNKTQLLIQESFLLQNVGSVDDALDCLYEGMDSLLWDGEFEDIDLALKFLDFDKVDMHIVVGLLVNTRSAKDKLPNRGSVLKSYREFLAKDYENVEQILYGLD